jgi:hypothetical protein
MDGKARSQSRGLFLCPTALREELEHALKLTRELSELLQRVIPGEALFVWLLGRDEEVRTLVGAILKDWSEGAIDTPVAVRCIRTYVRDLEQSLGSLYPRSQARDGSHASRRLRRDFAADETTVHEP